MVVPTKFHGFHFVGPQHTWVVHNVLRTRYVQETPTGLLSTMSLEKLVEEDMCRVSTCSKPHRRIPFHEFQNYGLNLEREFVDTL